MVTEYAGEAQNHSPVRSAGAVSVPGGTPASQRSPMPATDEIPLRQSRRHPRFGPLLLYAAISVIILDHGASLNSTILGQSTDRFAFIWFFRWWPWAISHHLNPLFTTLVWQPVGDGLLWLTSVPLLALVMSPVSVLAGPVMAYNLVILAAPVLSAWMMYLLCLRITGRTAAALIGGFLFGFSSYQTSQDLSAINLSFTAFLPLLLILVLARLNGDMTRATAVVSAAIVLIAEFFISAEIFCTIVVFGGLSWLLAVCCFRDLRQALRALLIDGLIAATIVAMALSPLLYAMFSHLDAENVTSGYSSVYVLDIVNLFVPSSRTALGGAIARRFNSRFVGAVQEQDGYFGAPLILLIVLYGWRCKRNGPGRYLIVLLAVFLVASCGPVLWVDGRWCGVVLPWAIVEHLPLVSSALPARFALYVSFVGALISASWIAAAEGDHRRRLCLGLLACAAILPAWYPHSPAPDQAFFAPGALQAVLGKAPRLLILPFGSNGPSAYWQQENHFQFAQTGGYLGFPPRGMSKFPAVYRLSHNDFGTTFRRDLVAFCVGTGTRYIVAAPGTPDALVSVLKSLHWRPRQVDNMTIFSVPKVSQDDH